MRPPSGRILRRRSLGLIHAPLGPPYRGAAVLRAHLLSICSGHGGGGGQGTTDLRTSAMAYALVEMSTRRSTQAIALQNAATSAAVRVTLRGRGLISCPRESLPAMISLPMVRYLYGYRRDANLWAVPPPPSLHADSHGIRSNIVRRSRFKNFPECFSIIRTLVPTFSERTRMLTLASRASEMWVCRRQ